MDTTFNPRMYPKLRGRIVEKYGSIAEFGKETGLSDTQVSKKLNGKAGFSQEDIIKWSGLLDIDLKDVGVYFYAIEV